VRLAVACSLATIAVVVPSAAFTVFARGAQGRTVAGLVPYGGGPVLHANRTHVIYWLPAGSGLAYDHGYQSLIDTFLTQVAADSHKPTNVYALSGQYRDSDGPAGYSSTVAGSVVATDRLPRNGCTEPPSTGPGWRVCLTDAQLEAEIEHVVRVDRLPANGGDIYFLVTPNGLGSCTDGASRDCALGGSASGYCGYHSSTLDGILYANIPCNALPGHCQSDNPRPNASTADPALSTISHEQIETITDPDGDAWINSMGNEVADICSTRFGPTLGGSGDRAWNEVIQGGTTTPSACARSTCRAVSANSRTFRPGELVRRATPPPRYSPRWRGHGIARRPRSLGARHSNSGRRTS
jgi:hypothetical protein